MNCPCDGPEDLTPPAIPAGLDDLPRQWSTFSELRLAMLDRAQLQPALTDWTARAKDDYGVMWLELWAYVGELLSLYDKAIADESYVRTAKLRPSLRRLVELLGYLPRPAVAATAELAVRAGGTKPVTLSVGTGFRSGSFDGEAPHVFELLAPTTIHPALNQWPIRTPDRATLTGTIGELLLDPATARVAVGDIVLIELGTAEANAYVRTVATVTRKVEETGRRVVVVGFDRSLNAGTGTAVSTIRIRKASRSAGLKPRVGSDGASASFYGVGSGWGAAALVFDGAYREVRTGERFLLAYRGETRWGTIGWRDEYNYTVVPSSTTNAITISLPDNKSATVPAQTIRAVTAPHTWIYAATQFNAPSRKASATSPDWGSSSIVADFSIGLALIDAGRVLGAALRSVSPSDPLVADGARLPIGSTAITNRMIVRDAEQRGVAIAAGINLATGVITASPAPTWSPGLATPLTAHGNVVTVVRGEIVTGEVLGSGDATAQHQRFELAKKPLTYVAVAGGSGDAGLASSLRVWVDGLTWTEVQTFFGTRPSDQIYVVRQGDDGGSAVIFGDGVRGARVPSGASIIANYRFGAGAKAPPAGSITQIARPVAGLEAVATALAAGGGADAEPAESLRELAPRSALLLGRAISIADMEVAARLVPGVVTARADWAWDGTRQRPVAKVWVVAAASVVSNVDARLRAICDPDTPIRCEIATSLFRNLAIDLEIDPRRIAATVIAEVIASLIGNDGLLTPGRLGIGMPLLRSPLLAALLDHPGVTGVRGLTWNGSPLLQYGVDPGPGNVFDLTAGLTVTGSP